MILIILSDNNDAEILDLKKSVSKVLKKGIPEIEEDDSDFQSENRALKHKIKLLEKQIEQLKDNLSDVQNSTHKKDAEYEYLSQISVADGGSFGRADKFDNVGYYRLFNKNGSFADFEFCGNELEALQKYTSVLDPFCDYEENPEICSKIENVSSGKIEYDLNTNRWNVKHKIHVKLS